MSGRHNFEQYRAKKKNDLGECMDVIDTGNIRAVATIIHFQRKVDEILNRLCILWNLEFGISSTIFGAFLFLIVIAQKRCLHRYCACAHFWAPLNQKHERLCAIHITRPYTRILAAIVIAQSAGTRSVPAQSTCADRFVYRILNTIIIYWIH